MQKYRIISWGGSKLCKCGNFPYAIVKPILKNHRGKLKEVCKTCLNRLNVVEDKVSEFLVGHDL